MPLVRKFVPCTDKKENRIFFICKEIQSGAVAKSYMTNSLLIYGEIFAHFPIYEEALPHIWLCNCFTLNFLIYEDNFIFFFINVWKQWNPSYRGWKISCRWLLLKSLLGRTRWFFSITVISTREAYLYLYSFSWIYILRCKRHMERESRRQLAAMWMMKN